MFYFLSFSLSSRIANLLISWFILAIAVWLSQKLVLIKEKEKGFLSCLFLSLAGNLVGSVLIWIHPLGTVLVAFIWVLLIKVWFETGWLQAIVIAAVAWVVEIVISRLKIHF